MERTEKNNQIGREFRPEEIKMIAGLGNPGPEYRATYHNAGFLALDRFSRETPDKEWRQGKKFFYLKLGKLIMVKPSVFMNESGEAIKEAMKHFKIKTDGLLIIHDDSDIAVGGYKVGFGRGAAGHRGVASVIRNLKTQDIWRARIGIRNRSGKAGDFVLKKINPDDRKKLNGIFGDLEKILSLNDSDGTAE